MFSQSEQVDQIAIALCESQKAFARIVKDTVNPFYKSEYATLPSVIDATRTALATNGIAVVQGLGFDAGNCTVTTSLIHKSGQWVRSIAETPLSKQDAQGVGSAATYLRRYSLQAMLNISSEDDDDGNVASAKQERPAVVRSTVKQQLHASVNMDSEPNDYDTHMAQTAKKQGPTISEPQAKRFFAMAMGSGKSKQDVIEYLGTKGYERSGEILKAEYESVCEWAGK
jgi:hypothetical protein